MNLSTAIILLIVAAAIAAGAVSFRKRLAGGCCGGGESVRKVRPADGDASHYPIHKRVRVDGMVCANCARRVENAFNAREGMMARVDAAQGRADVYMKSPVSDGEIRRIVAEAGYSALGVSDAA